jgi:hypothetical protein
LEESILLQQDDDENDVENEIKKDDEEEDEDEELPLDYDDFGQYEDEEFVQDDNVRLE